MQLRLFLLLSLIPTVFAGKLITDKKATFCPQATQLNQDAKSLTWNGPHRWKSFNPSFAKKLTRLKKVQWQGTNIGTVICIYDTNNSSAFPVFLQGPGSYKLPTTGQWVAKKNYHVCVSSERFDCPLYHVHEHKERLDTDKDLMNFLNDVKTGPKPLPTQ